MAEIVGTLVRKCAVDGHFAGLGVDRDAGLRQAETLRERPAADGDQHPVAVERVCASILLFARAR